MRPMAFTHNNTLADDEPAWGEVEKTALPRAAHADQGEEGQKSTWKYPHHWVKGGTEKDGDGVWRDGTMYLHEGGLDAAWAAAQGARSGQEASDAVKAHLQAHRRALGKDDDGSQDRLFKGYSLKLVNVAKEAEIWLYEEIGSGWFGGVSAKQFAEDLKALGKVERISVHLNSPGGDVFDGLAIYNSLKQHRARVIMHIDGLAASIASLIAMAGDEIYMAENAFLMVHNAWGICVGNALDMRDMIEVLGKIDGSLVGTYARRTGRDEQLIADLMAAETWMNSQEALEHGFVDRVTEELKLAAHFDLSKFKYKKDPFAAREPLLPDSAGDIGRPLPPDLAIFEKVQEKINNLRERCSR